MITLVRPSGLYLPSYRGACDEFLSHGIDAYSFSHPDACDVLRKFDDYRNGRNLRPGRVETDYYWLIDSEKAYFIGEICIRRTLTPLLLRYGGHIGYAVRYSEWNRGYGSLMLRLALEKARNMGLTDVLITCDDDNPASARVMEHNGFCLKDKVRNIVDGKPVLTRRYIRRL